MRNINIGKSKIRIVGVIALLSVFLIFADSQGKLDFVFFPMRTVLAPVQKLSNKTGEAISSPWHYLEFVRSGEDRIKLLEQKNLELVTQKQRVKQLEMENVDLRKQLGVETLKTRILEPAAVLGVNRYLEFELSGNSPVALGQSVVYRDNFVGTVVKLGWGVGFIRLATDPESKIPARTLTASGIAVGQFNSGIIFDKIAKDEAVFTGELVETSGVEGKTPPHLIIGRVEKTELSDDQLFQQALVRPFVVPGRIPVIYIIVD